MVGVGAGGAAASSPETFLALNSPATWDFMSPETGTSRVFMILPGLSSLSGLPLIHLQYPVHVSLAL